MSTTAHVRALSLLVPIALAGIAGAACDPGGGGKIAANPCANGRQDPAETGVDCGGTCGACAGETCADETTCASHVCNTTCAEPSCTDGVKNGTEVRIDCGGASCGACLPLTCENHQQDPGETGIDCGGPCKACEISGDHCTNHVQDADQGEEGVDCGGTCTPCGADPTCDDDFHNQDESDKDCGGLICDKCANGKHCGGPSDCVSGVCTDTICGDAPASCTNDSKDEGESDTDCGGTCPGCATGRECGEHDDCLSSTCVFGICRDPSCSDDIQNQGETTTDCGGPKCGGCEDGLACVEARDCASEKCEDKVCVSCNDGAQNQDESDEDCGGSCSTKCALDKHCDDKADCETNNCVNGLCKEPGASAGPCTIEADCEDGFFCEYTYNEQSGAAADYDQECLAERDGAQPGADCEVYEDCAGFGCFNQFCSATCTKDGDCAGGQICASEEGLFDTDDDDQVDVLLTFEYCLGFHGAAGACFSGADCAAGKRCTIYLDKNLSGTTPDPDGPYKAVGKCENELAGKAAEGVQCEADTDCKSGLCSSQGICTRYCEGSADCPPVSVSGFGTLSRVCSDRIPWGGGGLEDPTTYVHASQCVALSGTHSLADCGENSATPFICGDTTEGCLPWIIAFGPDYKAKVEWRCLAGTGVLDLGVDCAESADCQSGWCYNPNDGVGKCARGCDPSDSDPCQTAQSGLTCNVVPGVERKGKFASNGVSFGMCNDQ